MHKSVLLLVCLVCLSLVGCFSKEQQLYEEEWIGPHELPVGRSQMISPDVWISNLSGGVVMENDEGELKEFPQPLSGLPVRESILSQWGILTIEIYKDGDKTMYRYSADGILN